MPVCDVCNEKIEWSDGYVLTTNQVVTNKTYWEFVFTHGWSYAHSIDPEGETVAMLAQQQAGQSTGWLVCESCSQLFDFDREIARKYAKKRSDKPPGSGPADLNRVGLAAAEVWKKLYGKYPSSIQVR